MKLFTKKLKLHAFSLAEVLLTLLVIGIVATMTIPTLTASHRKTETEAKLKKVYMTLSNAVLMSDQGLNNVYRNTNDSNNIYRKLSMTNINVYADNYENFFQSGSYDKAGMLSDGVVMAVEEDYFSFDLNGTKGPNKPGVDRFCFMVYSKAEMKSKGVTRVDSCFYSQNSTTVSSKNRGDLIKQCGKDTDWNSVKHKEACSALIMRDGWQIKDDYPKGI